MSVLGYAGDASDVGCVRCAPAHSLPCHAAGHGGIGGDGDDGGGCYCGGDGYDPGGCSVSPPHRPPPPLPPPLPPSPHAGVSLEASGCNLYLTLHSCHQIFDCAGRSCGVPSGGDGGGGDGGVCAVVFLVLSSEVAPLLPFFGLLQLCPPDLGRVGSPCLGGSHVNPSSWRHLASYSSAHP